MRTRLGISLLLALTVALLAALPVMAITKDYQQDFDHPFVGLIVFYDQNDDFSHRCSGSLIDATTFVTAGHCTDDEKGGVMTSARIWFNQSGGKDYDAATDVDPNSGYPWTCEAGIPCTTSHEMYDYGFDDFAGFPDTHDVGVVILDKPIQLGEYGELPRGDVLNNAFKGARGGKDVWFRASGFGLSYASPVRVVSFRERLMADGKLVNLGSANNAGFNLQTQGNGRDKGGTCSGDSGGPIFYPKGSNQIVAVTSFGMNANCRGVDFAYRLDRPAVLGWIADPD
jgi:hypothetical protein